MQNGRAMREPGPIMQELQSPLLSIIIPTRDRASDLRLCLDALHRAKIERMECIVVDDGSLQDCAAVVQSSPLHATLIRNPHSRGSGAARNIGAAVAQGDVLLFIDDDVCVEPASLTAVIEAFQTDPSLGAVMGRYDDAPAGAGFLSRFRNLLHAYTHRISAGAASTFWTGFGAVRASIFREHGGFTERARAIDDVEFGARLAASGVRIELRPDLQVKHLKRWTLGSMLKTDLLLRGVPWTLLLWRRRSVPNTLNLRHSSRWSVMLACLTIAFALLSLLASLPWIVPVLSVALVLLLNLKFYGFLGARYGVLFALRGVAAHWLYLWIAALSFFIGTAVYLAQRFSARSPQSAVAHSPAERAKEPVPPLAEAG